MPNTPGPPGSGALTSAPASGRERKRPSHPPLRQDPDAAIAESVIAPGEPWSDRLLELLGRAEGDLLAGLDLDRLAGCWVAPHPGGTRAHLEDTEARDPDLGALLQVLGEALHELAQHRLDLALRQVMALGQAGRQLLQADRRGRGTVRSCCGCL